MIVVQALVNGLVSGPLLAVPAIGFTAMFAVLRFPNFSVSGVATLGAFAGLVGAFLPGAFIRDGSGTARDTGSAWPSSAPSPTRTTRS